MITFESYLCNIWNSMRKLRTFYKSCLTQLVFLRAVISWGGCGWYPSLPGFDPKGITESITKDILQIMSNSVIIGLLFEQLS